jgi:hypothetical protein
MIKLKGVLHSCLTATILMIVLWGAALISTLIVVAMPLESSVSYFTLWIIAASPPLQYQFLSLINWVLSCFLSYKEELLLALALKPPLNPDFSQQFSKILFLISEYFISHFIEIFSALFTITWLSQNTGICYYCVNLHVCFFILLFEFPV